MQPASIRLGIFSPAQDYKSGTLRAQFNARDIPKQVYPSSRDQPDTSG